MKKDGDSPSSRRLRPIAIGSVIGRLISKCAAAAASLRFSASFNHPKDAQTRLGLSIKRMVPLGHPR